MIKIENLTKQYGEKDNITYALKNINLSIDKGEIICVIGESGSGKSTLINMISGIDKPSDGNIFVDNENISLLNETDLSVYRRRKIGMIYQQFNLIPILNIRENIELPQKLDQRKVDNFYLNELMSLLGIKNKQNNFPSELSGGQQQRVAICRALSNKPQIVLADEPTGNLDSTTSSEIINLFKLSAKRYNQTLILITHDISITKIADRILKMKDGQFI